MTGLHLVSHAKINLTLQVSPKREDGYHDIDSVVQIIDIADELRLTKRSDSVIEVDVDAPDIPSGANNLVYRACRAFFESTGIRAGVRCELTKRIPAQAGLGGGSANAAEAIVGLDRLYGSAFSTQRLTQIAAKVGSDVALFVHGGTVRIRGTGDRVEPLPDAPRLDLVIVQPEIGVSTAWAYAQLDKSATREAAGASDQMERAIRAHDCGAVIDGLRNDFDPVVSGELEAVRAAKLALIEQNARAAMLAGSGSAVFGIYNSDSEAWAAAGKLEEHFPSVFAAHTLTRSESRRKT